MLAILNMDREGISTNALFNLLCTMLPWSSPHKEHMLGPGHSLCKNMWALLLWTLCHTGSEGRSERIVFETFLLGHHYTKNAPEHQRNISVHHLLLCDHWVSDNSLTESGWKTLELFVSTILENGDKTECPFQNMHSSIPALFLGHSIVSCDCVQSLCHPDLFLCPGPARHCFLPPHPY